MFLSAALDTVLAPFETAISTGLVAAHAALTALGAPAASGVTWSLAIGVLVVAVRLALLPLALRQVRSARRLAVAAPALREIRERYRGARDARSLAAMRSETQAAYAEAGARPPGLLPLLLQAPVLLALYRVLSGAARGHAVGVLGPALVTQLDSASLVGAALTSSFRTGGPASVVAVLLTLVLAGTLWLSQHRQVTRNTPPAALDGVAGQAQRLTVWVMPLVTILSGLTFPLGLVVYFAWTNTWSLLQQLAVIRWLPTPGSPADAARAGKA